MTPQLRFLFIVSFIVFHHFPIANSTKQNPNPVSNTHWCRPIPQATNEQLQANIVWGCSAGSVDCKPIQTGGVCFEPDSLRNHACYVMNTYYQNHGRAQEACDFNGTGAIILTDLGLGDCGCPP